MLFQHDLTMIQKASCYVKTVWLSESLHVPRNVEWVWGEAIMNGRAWKSTRLQVFFQSFQVQLGSLSLGSMNPSLHRCKPEEAACLSWIKCCFYLIDVESVWCRCLTPRLGKTPPDFNIPATMFPCGLINCSIILSPAHLLTYTIL